MDSEWLQKTLHSFSDEIEQCDAGWQQMDLVFEGAEGVWFDSAALKFRKCYWDEVNQASLVLVNSLQEKKEVLDKALMFVKEAESHRKKLLIQFDEFSQAYADESELVSLLRKSIIDTEDEVDLFQQKMNEVDVILRRITG